MKYINYIISLVFIYSQSFGQDLLTRSEAVELALEFNYDIKVANNNIEIAGNNASIYNSGYLPRLSGRAGSNLSNRTVKRSGDEGINFNPQGITMSYNSAIEVNYTLFDGLGREYTFKRNKETAVLSELQARQIIEGALLQLFVSYYQVARLTENEISQKQTVDISKERLVRVKYGYEYGQNTQLDVLNAEVDVNTDSINYLTILQQVDNAKRDMNLLIGREVNTEFEVDTAVTYIKGLTIDAIVDDAMKKNVSLLQADRLIQNSRYNVNINRAGLIPSLALTGRYDWSKTDYDIESIFQDQTAFGPYAGLNLNWNIFDGGITKTRIQNAKIALSSQQILKDQTEQQLLRNLNNAWTVYETSLFVLEAQKTNLKTNRRNFDRTMEQNKLGQITSIVFRQAQANLLRAQLSYNQAKYDAKIAESALLQLRGNLLDTEF